MSSWLIAAPQEGHLSGSLTVLISEPSDLLSPLYLSGMTNDGASIVKPRATALAIPELALQAKTTTIITITTTTIMITVNIIVNDPKMSSNMLKKSNCNQFSPSRWVSSPFGA